MYLFVFSNVEVKRFLRKKSELQTTQSQSIKLQNSEQEQQTIDCGSVSSADSSSNFSSTPSPLRFGGIEFQREHTDKRPWAFYLHGSILLGYLHDIRRHIYGMYYSIWSTHIYVQRYPKWQPF